MQKVLEHEFGQEEGGNGMELYFCVSERVDGKVWMFFFASSCLCLLLSFCFWPCSARWCLFLFVTRQDLLVPFMIRICMVRFLSAELVQFGPCRRMVGLRLLLRMVFRVSSLHPPPPPPHLAPLTPPTLPYPTLHGGPADGGRPSGARRREQARDRQKQEGVRRPRHSEACFGRGGAGDLGDSVRDG